MGTQTTEHKLKLTDEVWKETRVQAALEEKTASEICAYVLRYYLDLPDDEKPAILIRDAKDGQPHSIYLEKQLWVKLIACHLTENRPISAILEQQLRAYMGLDLPEGQSP
jgi:hypothetical protein